MSPRLRFSISTATVLFMFGLAIPQATAGLQINPFPKTSSANATTSTPTQTNILEAKKEVEIKTEARTPTTITTKKQSAPKASKNAILVPTKPTLTEAEKEAIKAELKHELKLEMERSSAVNTTTLEEQLVVSTTDNSGFEGGDKTNNTQSFLQVAASGTKKALQPLNNLINDLANIQTAAGDNQTTAPTDATSITANNMDEVAASLRNLEPSVGHPVDITKSARQTSLTDRGLVAINIGQIDTNMPMAKTEAPSPREWSFNAGQSLRDVLATWSSDAGVEMIWGTPAGYAIPQTAAINGTYEQAVQTLLEQYSLSTDRPLGSLHVDPSSGKRTLVIQAQG